MASAGSIFVDLLLNDGKYVQGLNRSSQATRKAALSWQRDVNKTRDSFSAAVPPIDNITASVTRMGTAVAGALSVQKIIEYSDSYKNLQSRLGLVTKSAGELASVTEQLFAISQNNSQPLEATIDAYTRLNNSLTDNQKAQTDLVKFTDLLSKTLLISGTNAVGAATFFQQFGQAASSNFKAVGQELQTFADQNPAFYKILQDEAALYGSSLKKMAEEGKLSFEFIAQATLKASGQIEEASSRMASTVGKATTELTNALQLYIGKSTAVDAATGTLAEGMSGLAKFITDLANDANFADTTLTGLGVTLLDLYVKYQRFKMGNAERTNIFGLNDDNIKEYEENIRKAEAAIAREEAALLERQEMARDYLKDQNTLGKGKGDAASLVAPEAANYKGLLNQYDTYITGITERKQKFEQAQKDLKTLLNAGELDQEQYNKAIANLNKDFAEESGYKSVQKAVKDLSATYQEHQIYITGLSRETIQYHQTVGDLNDLLNAGKISQDQYSEALVRVKNDVSGLDDVYERYKPQIMGVTREQLQFAEDLKTVEAAFDEGRISAERYQQMIGAIGDEYEKSQQKAAVWAFDMEEAGKQASRNIQDAFADFLFDPFDKGMGGMIDSFANTMRRMIAEAESARILSAIFGDDGISFSGLGKSIGGFLGFGGAPKASGSTAASADAFLNEQFFDGYFADGGFIKPGHFGIAGEAGAELVFGGKTGASVIPQKAMGKSVVINQTNHFAPGVSRAEMAQIIPQIRDTTKQAVLEEIGRGGKMSQAVGRRA